MAEFEHVIKHVIKLTTRMLNFDGNFDGYPSMTCADEGLVWNAIRERAEAYGAPKDHDEGITTYDVVPFLCYLASETVVTREQYDNCRAFIDAYVDAAWNANMCEGCNSVHEDLEAEQYA